ncbi:MAG: DUF2752 domain-containing protein [Myxococcaceae bacterium]
MAASFVFPIKGLGVDLCMLHAFTGLPCPGCGMTRAIAALSQGEWMTALALNPFSVLAWPTFLVLAVLALAGAARRDRFEGWLRSRGATVARIYRITFTAFLGFGVIRLLVFLFLGERFP